LKEVQAQARSRAPSGLPRAFADNFILQHFVGATRNQVKCAKGHVSATDSAVLGVLELLIPDQPSRRLAVAGTRRTSRTTANLGYMLEDCLDFTFNSSEKLEGANRFRCKKCNDLGQGVTSSVLSCPLCMSVDAVKSQVIAELPQHYVLLHINRTKFSPKNFQSFKCRNKITFPLKSLDMAPYVGCLENKAPGIESKRASAEATSALCDLYAVIVHHGRG
jgi:hypothetical protein